MNNKKNMKKVGETKLHRLCKKALSCFLATGILFSSVPLSPFEGMFHFELPSFPVFAANKDTKGGKTYPDVSWGENGVYEITTLDLLCEYSQAYYSHAANHDEDTIVIAIGGEDSTKPLDDFFAIGTQGNPFKGTVRINSASVNKLNLPESFFDYVYDSVKFLDDATQEETGCLTISRIADNTGEPILAKHVCHNDDDDNDDISHWKVNIVQYNDGETELSSNNGGILGEMGDHAKLIISETDGNAYSAITTPYIYTPSGDIGRICGTMGAGAELTVQQMDDTDTGYSIRTDNGNAGGIVGSMGSGAKLFLNQQLPSEAATITAAGDGHYAGGIVGYNDGGSIIFTDSFTAPYVISTTMNGVKGAGGIFGYYTPAPSDTVMDASKFAVNCKVNGSGSVGGLIGKLVSDHSYTIQGGLTDGALPTSVKSIFESGSADQYGGLIGCYESTASSLSTALTVKDIISEPNKTGSASFYGGGIGFIADYTATTDANNVTTVTPGTSVYVKFDNFNVDRASGAGDMTFGGLTASADYSFIEGNDVTVSVNGKFRGGAAVGSLANGVLKFSGDFNISGALPNTPSNTYKEGKIVGYRDNALVYADGWTYTGNDAEVDNIGSWGDIIVANGTKLSKSDFITENADHTITLAAPAASISSVADYAKASLAFSIDESQNPIIAGSSDVTLSGITFGTATAINLTGTGLRGITRDNYNGDSNSAGALTDAKCVYSGTITGGGSTLTLDFQNVGGYPVYRHTLNGLVGVADGVTVNNLTFAAASGDNYIIKPYTTEKNDNAMFCGSVAGRAKGSFTADNVTVNTKFNAQNADAKRAYHIGGLVAQTSTTISNITVSNSTLNSIVTDTNDKLDNTIGGAIGWLNYDGNDSKSWNFSDLTIKGAITSNGKSGGLIAAISETKNKSNRSLALTNVNLNGLKMSGSADTMGGLLGYSWLNVNTTFHNVTATGTNSISNMVSADLAGLIYNGTGHWIVEKVSSDPGITLNGLTATASSAKSYGMIVNKGTASNSAIFLEIKNGGYSISSFTDELKSGCVYDELVAYSASGGKVNENGQGVVSINVGGTGGGLTMNGSSVSNTYVGQTTRGQSTSNSNTRYYYNLDTIRTNNSPSDSEKLMLWALNRYAHSSINTYFTAPEWDNTIPSAEYNMVGYSWYPVDVSDAVSVNGSFTFYNGEFEGSENAKSNTKYTSLGTSGTYTQHHLMQNGLLRDVLPGGNVTIGTVSFSGNVGADDYGLGALVYGTVKGESASKSATISMAEGRGITLDGIYVHNLSADAYAPLLINKATKFSTIVIQNVSNTSNYTLAKIPDIAYETKTNGTTKYPKAASSLLGNIGNASDSNVNIAFSNITLDGRKTENAGEYSLDSVYNTSCSLFTKATLLNCYQYDSGSTGTYQFTYDDDWGAKSASDTSPNRNVSYGSEISDDTAHNQYFGEEFWYFNEDAEADANGKVKYTSNAKYVRYQDLQTGEVEKGNGLDTSGNYIAPHDFSGFLPYVNDASTKANVSTEKKYQLSVNHAIPKLSGCGTYNGPYMIHTGEDLENIAKLISGQTDSSIRLPNLNANNTNFTESELYKKKWNNFGDTEYTWDVSSSSFKSATGNGYSKEAVRTYLAGAYYKLSGTINLPDSFEGLGKVESEAEYAVFRGYIIGDNNSIILNNSNPLIVNSYGSVVKDVTVTLGKDVVLNNQTSSASFWYNNTTVAYGTVMSRILGGDNIIDAVSVNLGGHTIKIGGPNNSNNKFNKLVPIGGYVGTVVKGSLIFRNMNRSGIVKTGLEESSVLDYDGTAIPIKDNYKWLYINPIVGRVFNAAVFTESNAYRPFEDGTRKYFDDNGEEQIYTWPDGAVTMQNGTKNYSIADIDSSLDQFSVNSIVGKKNANWNNGDNSFRRYIDIDIDIPNAQSLYVISLISQAGISSSNFHARNKSGNRDTSQSTNNNFIPEKYADPIGGWYETDDWGVGPYNGFRTTHIANYDSVGNCGGAPSEEPSDSSHDYYKAKTDIPTMQRASARATRTETIPYIVYKFTPKLDTSSSNTEYRIKTIGNENYFADVTDKNLGYIAFNLTHQYSYLHINLTGNDTAFYLPDGFRGIGMIGYNNNFMTSNKFDEIYQDMITHIYGFNGNGKTISLNMSLKNYERDFDSTYRVVSYITGFGFFDSVMMNKSQSSDDIDITSTNYSINAEVFSINDISSECAVAVKFNGYDNYYVYINREYSPAMLGELVDALKLNDTISFGALTPDDRTLVNDYDRDVLTGLLNEYRDCATLFDYTDHRKLFSVSVNVDMLGISKKSLAVTEDGYITTNIMEWGYAFYIGEEKAKKIADRLVIDNIERDTTPYTFDPQEEVVYEE